MAFVEDIIFVVGLTGLVYMITDELLLIASASHKHFYTKLGSSRFDLSLKNHHKDSNFNDVIQKDLVFNETHEAKFNDFKDRECSGVGPSRVFNDTQEAEVDDFVQSDCLGVGQFKVFSDTQEAKVGDFYQSDCLGVGQFKVFSDTQEAEVGDFYQSDCLGVGQFKVFSDTQEAKVVDFDQSECSGVEQSCNGDFKNEVEVGTSRRCSFDEMDYVSSGDESVGKVVDQNFEFSGLDQGVEKLFDELSERDEVMEDEESVCFNGGDEVDKDEEEGWEDDWEGVERTELEKQFGAAVAFVNLKSNADRFVGVVSNVKIDLYALHKVAIEGICMKTQPMALKVYSRAKWNAWKRLENMSREEAMERYITLLSRTIPGWMENRHK